VNLRIEAKDGREITTVENWFDYAPPKKGSRQWKDGRSAKELAKVFLETGVPATPREIRDLLSSHEALGMVELDVIFPEHKIALDRFRGETRNADLAALGNGGCGRVAVTIEAKADEEFGKTVRQTLATAPPGSNLRKRIEALANAVLGHAGPEINDLRYQLLHATAASLIFARENSATAAVFVVLVFDGPSCDKENIARNNRDFDFFLKALSPNGPTPADGKLSGPFVVPGGEFVPRKLPLFIGKAVRILPQGF
jgi:hypothetical protein